VGNLKTLDCIIFIGGFLRISLNSVRVRQCTNNLEQEVLDDLVSVNMYVSGTYSPNSRGVQDPGHEEEFKLPLEIKFL
jgi:hypothetical protein